MKSRLFIIISFLLLSGCDRFYGIRMPVMPQYQGDWSCVLPELNKNGLDGRVVNANQLQVADRETHLHLFTAAPNRSSAMELYAMQIHSAPECARVNRSLERMRDFLDILEEHCGYHVESYDVFYECRSQNPK